MSLLIVSFRATPLKSRRFSWVLKVLIYANRKISGGMKRGIAVMEALGVPVTIWVIAAAPTV